MSVDFRSQLKATSLKKLKKRVEEDDKTVGVYSNDYLNLEDGKTLKIRIFPAHPGADDFYVPRKCYWLSVIGNDGDPRRTTVLDSKLHGGTKLDLVDEYVKFAKSKWSKDAEKLEALTGTGMNSNSLNPSYSWMCYADIVSGDEPLRAKVWEFKKMVRDLMNKLAFSEDEDDVIEVDPFTDVDDGLPIMVKYLKKPNKKKGENYYDVTFPKKVSPRALSDEEIEHFMDLKPLSEVLPKYSTKDFEKALEGLQNFDEEHSMDLFDDEEWLERVEVVKAQYDEADEEDEKPVKKKAVKKVVEDEDDEEEAPKAKAPKKSAPKKKVVEPEEEDDEEEDNEPVKSESVDELDELDRDDLKKHIRENNLEVPIKKSMSDDDIREAIRAAVPTVEEDDEEEDDDEEEVPKAKVSLSDIKKKLAGKK